jgi:hypothetical protein
MVTTRKNCTKKFSAKTSVQQEEINDFYQAHFLLMGIALQHLALIT